MLRSLSVVFAAILAASVPAQSQSLNGAYLGSGLPAAGGNFLSGFSGAYLAGRHAAARSNVDPAGAYFAKALSRDPGVVFTRAQLIAAVWGPNWVGNEHLVDVHIGHLRRKLGDDAALGRYVRTVRGVGYRMGVG